MKPNTIYVSKYTSDRYDKPMFKASVLLDNGEEIGIINEYKEMAIKAANNGLKLWELFGGKGKSYDELLSPENREATVNYSK